MPKNVNKYQELASDSLSKIFGGSNVIKEWNVAKESKNAFTRELYSPRLDIAIGPFNIDENIEYNQNNIKSTIFSKRSFIETMLQNSEPPTNTFTLDRFLNNINQNPRCFLAIEIENSGSSKHMLGNIVNVSILASIGVVIPFSDKKLSLCKRITKYVTFATEVRKLKGVFKNVLIINKANFWRLLESYKQINCGKD